MSAQINLNRLKRNLEHLASFGRKSSGGINRQAFSEADRKARAWLFEQMEAAGLQARVDAAGNVWGRMGPAGPAVLAGSHLDTVPDGGMFDGALGILAALEGLQTIQENRLAPRLPLEIVAFSDEEGAFLSFLGSRAAAGTLSTDDLAAATDLAGNPLPEKMTACGLNPAGISQAVRNPKEIKAYLELHIEQGPRLDSDNIPIGIVRSIVGIVFYQIKFAGQANHAGTTPLNLRRDAFLGAAEFSLKAHDSVRSETSGVVTAGNAKVLPGASNIIPGEVHLALEFRDASAKRLDSMEASILKLGREIAARRDLEFDAKRISRDAPVRLTERVIGALQTEAEQLGYPYMLLDSGAGHDAQILAQVTEAGMIFIPSTGGMSHCPREHSHWNDIEKGAQLLLNGMLRLANEETGPR